MKVTAMRRVFRYNGLTLADPNPAFSAEQVRDVYQGTYPELTTATLDGPAVEGDAQVYTFTRAVGHKG